MWARIIDGGGRENFAFLREPTCLHFRAHWRTEEIVIHQLGPDWEPFRALGTSIPAALQIQSTDTVTPQEAVWEAISAQPEAWITQLRAGIGRVLDLRVSGDHELIKALQRQAARSEQRARASAAEAAEHRHQVQALAAEAAERQQRALALELELNEITMSKAWRAAVWLRRLRMWMVPPRSRRARLLRLLYRFDP
jgi:hypothetical protein